MAQRISRWRRIATFFFLSITISASAWALSPPTLSGGHTVDFDNYGILLNGANFDSSCYVDIRPTTSTTLLMSVSPPNITYIPGSQAGTLSFRINDPSIQSMLASQGLRFYVVSPNASYQFAGPLTVNRGTPSYSSQPSAFHTIFLHSNQGSWFATLADDTGSPSPRQQTIASLNNMMSKVKAAGMDTVTVTLPDNDGWPSQTGGGFAWDPAHYPTPQQAVGEEIIVRIAAANNLKVIFAIAVNLYRESTDGRAAWAGLADQYDVTNPSVGGLDFIHSLIDPAAFYGSLNTTKLETIGLTNGPIRSYFNDPRVVGWLLAPEWNPLLVSSNGVEVNKYFFQRYWNYFNNLVHYGGSTTAFAGTYVGGNPPSGVPLEVSVIKDFKSWFKPGSGVTPPDRVGIEFYGGSPYALQNIASDLNVELDAMINADTAHYPGDFAIASTNVFLGEGNTDEAANPYTNQYYQYMLQLVNKRVLSGVEWWESDTLADGNPPQEDTPSYSLWHPVFTKTGAKVFPTTLPAGKVWHLGPHTNYADPTDYASSTDDLSVQWGVVSYASMNPKGYWYSEAVADSTSGKNVVAYAQPNPMTGNASHLGTTTFFWDATEMPSVTSVQIHLGSPSGTLVGSGAGAGSVAVSANVSNGSIYFVQDVTGGKALTAANTLAQIYANVQ